MPKGIPKNGINKGWFKNGGESPRKGISLSFNTKNQIKNTLKKRHANGELKQWNDGIKMPNELIEKNREGHRGQEVSNETRTKLRLSKIEYVEKTKFDGMPLYPTIGKYEKKILDFLEKSFAYPILRQYKVAGFFVDGYCPVLNLAIEIDESFHKKNLEKDKMREINIKQKINCQFLRIAVGGN